MRSSACRGPPDVSPKPERAHLLALQVKAQTAYQEFIESGQLLDERPHAAGRILPDARHRRPETNCDVWRTKCARLARWEGIAGLRPDRGRRPHRPAPP